MLSLLVASVIATAFLMVVTAAAGVDAVARASSVSSSGQRVSSAHPDRIEERSVPSAANSLLSGVSCVSTSDCWAVGSYQRSSLTQLSLAEHWNGTSWAVQTSPNPSVSVTYRTADLRSISCVSASDCWAVGTYASGNEGNFPGLVEHWNGSRWTLVANPKRPSSALLFGISCTSASNCWAVGEYQAATHATLDVIEHWNGTVWALAAGPNPSSLNSLLAISCVNVSDCWAVGDHLNGADASLTLVEHWNGTMWSEMTNPNQPGASENQLYGVSCVSVTDCWAVGDYQSSSDAGLSLVEHWNGNNWSTVPSPNRPGALEPEGTALYDLSCANASDCWAVGYWFNGSLGYITIIEHWNGARWVIASTLLPRGRDVSGYLDDISCVNASDCWAVGSYQVGVIGKQTQHGLFEHWNGARWSVVSGSS